jgi:glycosyltransferase involved in cell wall biosynthesis
MDGAVDVVECGPQLDGSTLIEELRRPRVARYILVRGPEVRVGDQALATLLDALAAPMAATASPLPVPTAGHTEVAVVATHPSLPPPPTVALACPTACVVSRDALASVPLIAPAGGAGWRSTFAHLNQRLTDAGWRHVAAPGATLAWSDTPRAVDHTPGAWSRATIDQQNGPANEGLATHVLWASTRLRPMRLLVDGACLTDALHNGSQVVVVNVSRALCRVHPDADVVLAAPRQFVGYVRSLVASDGVQVIERRRGVSGFDVVYRPYQLLDPADLHWLSAAAARLVVSQLDMIAFANPSYHPSAALYHGVRNLQRHTMRLADGVTFISHFGMQTAIAECPDLDRSRCFVVSCGADAQPPQDREPSTALAGRLPERYIACLSATFWHKNRQHAVAVFDALCREHGYDGSLLIAGPEPYYGSSAFEDATLLQALPPHVRDRIVVLGQVSESDKWALLARAELVLYPSLVEGFGLVPFEAAAVGTPSLAPGASALGEVFGDARCLVQSWDVAEWARAAAAIVGSSDTSAELVADVRRVARGLTWDATADRTWAAIEATLARPHARRHAEEGGAASRVAGATPSLAAGARTAHFANRLAGYIRRRVRGTPDS